MMINDELPSPSDATSEEAASSMEDTTTSDDTSACTNRLDVDATGSDDEAFTQSLPPQQGTISSVLGRELSYQKQQKASM